MLRRPVNWWSLLAWQSGLVLEFVKLDELKEMSLKFDNFLKPFRGQQDDLEAFWAKFEVTAKLQKWDTDAVKMANFPLFLAGEAFMVWSELSDADKKDPEKVKAALSAAFSLTPAQAYSVFVSRTLGGGSLWMAMLRTSRDC